MSSIQEQMSDIQISGQLLGFIFKDGYKLKYLRIKVSEREYWFKVPKSLRQSLDPSIQVGCFLEIQGMAKLSRKTGKLTLIADFIQVISSETPQDTLETSEFSPSPKVAKKSRILVCQKSDCWKRGGKAICEKLQQELRECGLSETVTLQKTGCLKKCKKGPNVVVLPDKVHYPQFNPEEVPYLVQKHYLEASV